MSSTTMSAAKRYLVVTAVATPSNIAVTWLLLTVTTWHPLWCNLVAATVLTVPTYVACVQWVWPAADTSVDRATAFWVSSLVNVAAASGSVWLVARSSDSDALLALTPFATYTALWLVRFAFLDRVLLARALPDQATGAAPTAL